ncbi:YtxH domain-containing protein [Niabella pedocola]|uniref:YtxH domain-containing protein n=1 Tax=Niabella pedocola TaxID=1752077 RepID=A0ABS8PKR0_9BACT|nr:YtxH domain-containing protein [Niabella pedocola]MCD2421687.1 YtxH domain-containing protein [Niabella pedocola]
MEENKASFFDKAKETLSDLKEKAGEAWDKTKDTLEDAWDVTKNKAEELKDSIGEKIDTVRGKDDSSGAEKAQEKVADAEAFAKEKLNAAKEGVANLADKADQKLEDLKDKE